MKAQERLIAVSNRLPITIESDGERRQCESSSGGLVSALLPILSETRGCWVGWTGTDHDPDLASMVSEWAAGQPYTLEPVFLTPAEKQCFYVGYSNEVIWPLFHGFPSRCNFEASYWPGYCMANERFADAVEEASRRGDFIWIHDYHLMMLGRVLRARKLQNRIAYFHHIPFPSPDVFEMLPRRSEILRALIHYDAIGFQTGRDCRNFAACLQHCLQDVHVASRGNAFVARTGNHETVLTTNPISIDYDDFAGRASSPAITAAADSIRARMGGNAIVLGVDRLDYTKGIPQRLAAFRALLAAHPELRGSVRMLQVVVPSREEIPEYAQLKMRIETLVSEINSQYGEPGWVPIHYFYRRIQRDELIAYYRAASIAAVTPLRDGMNLIAKEFCASRADGRGVLLLSEFAGAAEELKCGALTVNPNDIETLASTMYRGLRIEEADERARMQMMRSKVRANDVFRWARACSPAEADLPITGPRRPPAARPNAAYL